MRNLVIRLILIVLALTSAAFAQWSQPKMISMPGGSTYPQILAVGDTLHVVYNNNRGGWKVCYARSTNAGLTWEQHRVLSDTANTENTTGQRIMSSGSRLLVAWSAYRIHPNAVQGIYYSISTNSGVNWSSNQRIDGTHFNDIMVYVTAVGFDSLINIIVCSRPQIDTLAFYDIRSTDFGSTWSVSQRVFWCVQSGKPDIGLNKDKIYYAWGGNFAWSDTWELYYIRSTDGGLSWSDSVSLSTFDDLPSQSPAISFSEQGNPAISWFDYKYSPYMSTGDIFCRWSFDGGTNWIPESQATHNHFANFSDIVWDRDIIHVVWMDLRFGYRYTIYYRNIKVDSGIWSPEQRLEEMPSNSKDPAMAVSGGKVYVIWYEDRYDGQNLAGIYFARYPNFPTGISESEIPEQFEELAAYPNPFNSSTIIQYSNFTEGGHIEIYNVTGQKVRVFQIEAGKEGQIKWDATDAKGNRVSSGIYFARASAPQEEKTIKLIYLK
jgi:hypothetical protein